MPALSDLDKERVYFHLGMGSKAGIDVGDLAEVEQACTELPSDYMLGRVLEQLETCDLAYEAQKLVNTSYRYGTRELYSGDIDRAIIRESSKDVKTWKENYLDECRELARILWVPLYREAGMDSYRFSRAAGAFINAVPGPADTSVSSRRLELQQLGGGFGF